MNKMILERLFKEIENCYGKKIKKYEIDLIEEGHIFYKLIFNKDENLMLKIWLKEDYENYNNPYELILYNDNIYSNKYLMKDLDNLHTFLNKFNSNKLDYILNNYSIELSNKMEKYINKALNSKIEKYIQNLNKRNIEGENFWIDMLTNTLTTKRFLNKHFKSIDK